ncbi:NAD-dependent aldehyde dehydrogenase [Auricularia subglabra TFB-10046 SS5]|nr:NAD-dependent aldehyde dehydrogenase [Auricularia subglabra TFB-10046 SS5]
MAAPATPLEDIPQIRARLRAGFATGKTKDVAFRKEQLLQLAYMIQDNRDRFLDALASDLGRPRNESTFVEYSPTLETTLKAYQLVDKWAKPEGIPFSVNTFAMRPRILKEPKGTALIIGPFNYPVWCTIGPLVGAIAAGCAVVLKPSELSPATAALFTELFPKYLDPSLYAIVNGAVPETAALLDLQWDHIFFTGSERVGKIVAAAAAKHLTPTTLELGGKNPAIVDKDCDLDATARRILWGKTVNAGQSCTAPDYALVVRDVHDRFVAALQKAHKEFFGGAPKQEQMSHVVNGPAFKRLKSLLEQTKGKVILGGQSDEQHNWIATTVVDGCLPGDSLLETELFGPILPIQTIDSVQQAVQSFQGNPHPLGLYIFSQNQKTIDYVFSKTISGTVLANESVIQPGIYGLPFGGIGSSGHGYSGSKFSFDEFTHTRASMRHPSWLEKMMAVRYPPHTPAKLSRMQAMLVPKIPYARPGTRQRPWGKLVAGLAVVVGIVAAWRAKNRK